MADEFEKATPRPWRWAWNVDGGMLVSGENDIILWPHNAADTGNAAGWLGACGITAEPMAEANARLIVAAVNERDALREALNYALVQFDRIALINGRSAQKSIIAGDALERIRKLLESGNV